MKDDEQLPPGRSIFQRFEPKIQEEFKIEENNLERISQQITIHFASICSNGDVNRQLISIQFFRQFVSIENNPSFVLLQLQAIDSGVIPYFLQCLQRNENLSLQLEAGWTLIEIVSGSLDGKRNVVEAGAIPIFIHLLTSLNDQVRVLAVYALGSIGGDSAQYRDVIISAGGISALLQMSDHLNDGSRVAINRSIAWTLANLSNGKPCPNFESVRMALPLLSRLFSSEDIETVRCTCWAFSYISDGPDYHIQALLDTEIVPRMIELLGGASTALSFPVLRTVGNMVKGDDIQTQFLINLKLLPLLLWLLDNPQRSIRKETCWAISNITSGTSAHVQAVIEAAIFPKLLELARTSEFEDIHKEVAWIISHVTSEGSVEHLLYLIREGAIRALCSFLNMQDPAILKVALEGLIRMLQVGKMTDRLHEFVTLISDCDGIYPIEKLQEHVDPSISYRANNLLQVYFNDQQKS